MGETSGECEEERRIENIPGEWRSDRESDRIERDQVYDQLGNE